MNCTNGVYEAVSKTCRSEGEGAPPPALLPPIVRLGLRWVDGQECRHAGRVRQVLMNSPQMGQRSSRSSCRSSANCDGHASSWSSSTPLEASIDPPAAPPPHPSSSPSTSVKLSHKLRALSGGAPPVDRLSTTELSATLAVSDTPARRRRRHIRRRSARVERGSGSARHQRACVSWCPLLERRRWRKPAGEGHLAPRNPPKGSLSACLPRLTCAHQLISPLCLTLTLGVAGASVRWRRTLNMSAMACLSPGT